MYKVAVVKKILRTRNCRRASACRQKFASWKTQRKHVNQTTAIKIAIELPNAQIIVTGLFPRSQTFSYFRQIVNDVNIELGNACSLYQIIFLKPNNDWLQANGKLNPQLFWDDDLHLSKTGYQKFATSLFNFISSCSTSKSTSLM